MNKRLSIVVPIFDEENNIDVLAQRLSAVLDSLPFDSEIILVDDGSTDDTWREIEKVCSVHARFAGYRLSRNFGHQNALLAGLSKATGDAVISMDGDLQHPPEVIPELLARWQAGYAIVNTRREETDATGLLKRLTSKYFYKVFSLLAEVEIAEGTSDFRLMDRGALDALLACTDGDLFMRGVVQWIGFRQTTVPYRVGIRHSGTSKYNLRKMIRFAGGAVVAFSSKPLRIGIWLGLMTSLLAFAEIVYIIVQFFLGRTVPGWASTLGVTSFLFGVLFILLGIVGTYLAAIHKIIQRRPPFIIIDEQQHQMTAADNRETQP